MLKRCLRRPKGFKKRQGKESAKEPGIHDRIKTLNNNAEPDQPHPHLTQLSKGKKMNTYEVLKANRKTQTKRNDCMGIYGFRSDDIFGFRSEDDLMPDDDLDSTKSTEKVGGSGIGKKSRCKWVGKEWQEERAGRHRERGTGDSHD